MIGRYWTERHIRELVKKVANEEGLSGGTGTLDGLALLMPVFGGPQLISVGGTGLLIEMYLRYLGVKNRHYTYQIEFKAEGNTKASNPQIIIMPQYGGDFPTSFTFHREDDPTITYTVDGIAYDFNKLSVEIGDLGNFSIINSSTLSWWTRYDMPQAMWGTRTRKWISQEFQITQNRPFDLIK